MVSRLHITSDNSLWSYLHLHGGALRYDNIFFAELYRVRTVYDGFDSATQESIRCQNYVVKQSKNNVMIPTWSCPVPFVPFSDRDMKVQVDGSLISGVGNSDTTAF